MSPPKLKPATNAPKKTSSKLPRPRARLLLLLLLPAACGPDSPGPAPEPEPLTLRVAPLHDYAWLDRNGTGQPDQFKPGPETDALHADLASTPAHILILRGLGDPSTLPRLQQALPPGAYPHALYLPGPTRYRGIGFLSQIPPHETLDLSPRTFRIRDRTHQPFAGAIRLHTLWIWNARAPAPEADYEQRRNEARLLSQALRDQLALNQHILLSLHSREDPDSPMIRMIRDTGLLELPVPDDRGDHWTSHDPAHTHYRRDQWIFISPSLAPRITHARIRDTPALRTAGPLRHQLLTLTPPEATPAAPHTPPPADPAPAQTPPPPHNTDPEPP